jgi:hypothetical protein
VPFPSHSLTLTLTPVSPSPDLYYIISGRTGADDPHYNVDRLQSAGMAASGGKSMLALLLWSDAMVAAWRSITRLVSFSLPVTPGRVAIDFWLPRRAVALLAAGLPASCVAIEIDTRGWDVALSRTEPHLCDVLRAALPWLRHLRLAAEGRMPGALLCHATPMALSTAATVTKMRRAMNHASAPAAAVTAAFASSSAEPLAGPPC